MESIGSSELVSKSKVMECKIPRCFLLRVERLGGAMQWWTNSEDL